MNTRLLRLVRFAVLLATIFGTTVSAFPGGLRDEARNLAGGKSTWKLVGFLSGSGGMFKGDNDLKGTVNFARSSNGEYLTTFPADAEWISFRTKDWQVQGLMKYQDLRRVIDAREGNFEPNIDVLLLDKRKGLDKHTWTKGNVLSRSGAVEDPWISLEGGHYDGINNEMIVWGENGYGAGTHQNLKNKHGGMEIEVFADWSKSQNPTTPTSPPKTSGKKMVEVTGVTCIQPSAGVDHTLNTILEVYKKIASVAARIGGPIASAYLGNGLIETGAVAYADFLDSSPELKELARVSDGSPDDFYMADRYGNVLMDAVKMSSQQYIQLSIKRPIDKTFFAVYLMEKDDFGGFWDSGDDNMGYYPVNVQHPVGEFSQIIVEQKESSAYTLHYRVYYE